MPRTYALLYDKHNRCFFQFYKDPTTGKRRKKHCGSGAKTNRQDYQKALAVWNEFKAELDEPIVHRRKKRSEPLKFDIPKDKLSKDTIIGLIDIYMLRITARAIRNKLLSPRTAKNRGTALKYFVEFLGPKSTKTKEQGWGVEEVLTNQRWAGFHEWMTRNIHKENRWAFSTGQMYFNVVKQFVRWACHYTDIEGPTNLNNPHFFMKQANIISEEQQEDTKSLLSSDDIGELFRACSQYENGHPNMLYLLLALNTGMAPVDIGTLQFYNIKFDEDGVAVRIHKQRTKTGIEGKWKLWNITSRYLTQHLNQLPKPTHRNTEIPLKEHFIFRRYITNSHKLTRHPVMLSQRILNTKNIQYQHTTALTGILNRIFSKSGIDKTSYSMRKTFASHAAHETNFNTPMIAYFMAHKQKTMAMTNYVKQLDQETFDEVINKLLYSMGIDQHVHFVHTEMKERKRRFFDGKREEANSEGSRFRQKYWQSYWKEAQEDN